MQDDDQVVKIRSDRLTTCCVAPDGGSVRLEFIEAGGAPVTLELPFDQAEAVVMTLPHLLARALQQQTGDHEARYVFDLGEWSLESAENKDCLIGTLKTTDGFEVSFGIPFEACRSLGSSLLSGADRSVAAGDLDKDAIPPRHGNLN